MKATLASILGAALLGAASPGVAAEIDVMTQNQYIGADLAPVLAAATAQPFDSAAFNAAVVAALGRIAAGRPTDRARALAAEIAKRNPDVVGLQEVFKLECLPIPGVPGGPGVGCDDPAIRGAFRDRLQDTAAALLGEYVVAGKVTNFQVAAIPFSINGFPAVLAIADRDAILVRKGLLASPVDFLGACATSDQGCNYRAAPPPVIVSVLPLPPVTIQIVRGFLAVDVTVKNRAYRVFNTHLEQRLLAPSLPQTRVLQVLQAQELAAFATLDPTKTVIVVGDFNSDPRDTIPSPPFPAGTLTPYMIFTSINFTDAWTMRSGPGDGLTCCEEEDLANRRSDFEERIDMIFSLPRPSRVVNMRVLGAKMGDKTRPPGKGGLWPSDHAALAAKLKYD